MIPFAGNPLNRVSEKRTDAAWIESKRRDPSSLILPMWRLEPFLLGPENSSPPIELGLVRPGIADSLADKEAPSIFLGLDGLDGACDVVRGDDALEALEQALDLKQRVRHRHPQQCCRGRCDERCANCKGM